MNTTFHSTVAQTRDLLAGKREAMVSGRAEGMATGLSRLHATSVGMAPSWYDGGLGTVYAVWLFGSSRKPPMAPPLALFD